MLEELEDSRPDLNTISKQTQYLDAEYGDIVGGLAESVAALRLELLDFEATGIVVGESIDYDKLEDNLEKEEADNEEKQAEVVADEIKLLQMCMIYDALKNYEGGYFAKGDLLDFFLQEVDEDDTERYYPMAAAFTDGQRGGMDFISFKDLLRYAFMDFDSWKDDIKKNTKLDELENDSVYKGINREMFSTDGSIAYTGAATRADNISHDSEDEIDDATAIKWLLWGSTAFCGIIFGIAKIGERLATQEFLSYVNLGSLSENKVREVMSDAHIRYKPVYNDWESMSYYADFLKFATLFLAIAASVYTIYTLIQKDEVELKPIPKYFVDNKTTENGESYQLNYQAVECNREDYNGNAHQTGSSADLNADEGRQWLAIYVSKNSMAGNPVLPEFDIAENISAPAGMSGSVHLLGEKGAVNLSDKETMNYSKMYSAYRSLKDKITGDIKSYLFFKLSDLPKTYDESAGNMTATAMSDGMSAAIGFGCLVLGGVFGAVITVIVKRKKENKV